MLVTHWRVISLPPDIFFEIFEHTMQAVPSQIRNKIGGSQIDSNICAQFCVLLRLVTLGRD